MYFNYSHNISQCICTFKSSQFNIYKYYTTLCPKYIYIYYITPSGLHNICASIHDSLYHILNQPIHILIISISYSESQFTFLISKAYQFIPHKVACTLKCQYSQSITMHAPSTIQWPHNIIYT